MKIDKRKKYILVLDTETTNNNMEDKYHNDGLVYDIGIGVYDKQGNCYLTKNWVIIDIFDEQLDLMNTAYYGWKLPQYYAELLNGTRERINIAKAKKLTREIMEIFNISEVYAYNMAFDLQTLNNTIRYASKSKIRYFFPYDTKVFCIWNMACQVICTQKTFQKQNIRNNNGNLITNAERVYGYITDTPNFEEAHTGLEDVKIEAEILAKCFQQHKRMNKNINRSCWRIPQ